MKHGSLLKFAGSFFESIGDRHQLTHVQSPLTVISHYNATLCGFSGSIKESNISSGIVDGSVILCSSTYCKYFRSIFVTRAIAMVFDFSSVEERKPK
jgi:hypothetical protein